MNVRSKILGPRLRVAGTFFLVVLANVVQAQNYSRTETITYHDNTAKWVLGQVSSKSINGIVAEQTSYDANTALPLQSWSFGKLKQTLTYNADGTVATVKDGNNNVTTLSSWKRGIPQSITYANGTTQSAVVNDNGWITQVTDQNGNATNYSYDAMGRLAQTNYPVADSVNWNVSGREFRAVNSGDWKPAGVVDGQWRLQEVTGNHVTYTYYDALWRPVLKHNYDISNIVGTLQSTSIEYDAKGRVVFQSYPSSDVIPAAQGTWTLYDALDRPTHVKQDSEHGLLVTTTSYLKDAMGAYTLTKNPRGGETRTWYQMFDQPSYDAPVRIVQPEDAVTTITRDVFGKPTAITRGNGAGSLQITRTYAYNGNQELCRSVEPETGATLMGYDGAGNLTWSASGVPAWAGCESGGWSAEALPRRIGRSYDNMNRLETLGFPDGRGNQTWSYHADGLPYQVWTNNVSGSDQVINRYYYNKRRLLVHEQVEQPGWYTWGLSYGYDANGNLASQGYPTGNIVTYSPNALGQPTLIADTGGARYYASNLRYYPNGAVKSFTYGNNILHGMAQNVRQLPVSSVDAGVSDLQTNFDANGNVIDIYDVARGSFYNRHMQYDGLDRLIAAGSWVFGGDAWHRFSYDSIDNLKSWKLGAGGKDYANYYYEPATNRLTAIQNSGGATVVGLAYDVQGNLQNKNGQAYEFDFGNRLRAAPGQGSLYRYDAHGRRVLMQDTQTGDLSVSQYSSAGQLMYQEKTGGRWFENIYLSGSLLAIRHAGENTIKFQHTDALGSPVAVTDAAGNVVERNDYEPYGAIIGKPAYDAVGYTGHKQDGATGLTYMQQRYYDPQIGRFLSVDPVTAYSNPVGAFNRYWYANNNPYKFTDPDGRETFDCRGKGSCASEIKISDLKRGDIVKTDGATVRVGKHSGNLSVTFNKGYENGASAAATGPRFTPAGPPGANVEGNMKAASGMSPVNFRDAVKNKGPWDYKQQGSAYEEFGNYNYGATGRAAGFPSLILRQEAGIAQTAAGTTDQFGRWGEPGRRLMPWTGSGSFGDDPSDQFWIQQGIRRYEESK